MNTYIYMELVNGYLTDVETVRAENFREALIALEFRPYCPWGDIATWMRKEGLITEKELARHHARLQLYEDHRELDEEFAQAIADYAVEHWEPTMTRENGYYILEIEPDGSVTTRPEMTSRMEAM